MCKYEAKHCTLLYLLAIEVDITTETAPRASEGEHGQRYRDRDIDSNLTNVNILLEFPCH